MFTCVHQGCAYNNSVFIIFPVSVEQLSVFSPCVDWKALPAVSPRAVSRKHWLSLYREILASKRQTNASFYSTIKQ